LNWVKEAGERVTGIGRPSIDQVIIRARKPRTYHFVDDGKTPNNPRLPLVQYLTPIKLDPSFDPAAIFETLFAANKWTGSWRDGVYDFNHFHTHSHEVLGIGRGNVCIRFGGNRGRLIALKAGDVVILPAGTGHRRISQSDDLLVIGAYPVGSRYDELKPDQISHVQAIENIARVPVPDFDPVYGAEGPITRLWQTPERKSGGLLL
jgi:uncharacterized protein YjlB